MQTGIDIQFKDFKRGMWGFDVEEVKSFLETVSRTVESLIYENKVLKEKIREKELQLIEFKERESALKDTMMTAQRVTEGIKKEAAKEADYIIKQAKLKAESLISDSLDRMRKTLDETNRLKSQKLELVSNIKAFLESHLKMIEKYDNADEGVMEFDFKSKTLKTLTLPEINE